MAQALKDGTFACSICGKIYASPAHADSCRDSHEMLYIPITKTELNRLLSAIYSEDYEIIPFSLIQTLKKYARASAIDAIRKEN